MLRRRARDLVGLTLASAVLVGTGALARRGLTQAEARVFRVANSLPDDAFRAVWVPMQYGTFGAVPALGALAFIRRRRRLAAAVAVGGTAAWMLAKAAKPRVGRGRPAETMFGVNLRGKEEGDLGFPSGHAAVSAALTVLARPYTSREWRVLSTALAGFVPLARLYVGAHLPLDAIGGSALGVAIGCAVNLALRAPGRCRPCGSQPRAV